MANRDERIAAITANPRDIIQLNVGGDKFTTKRSTLCQVEGSLLASMFSGRWEDGLERDNEGCVFFDFNPKYFVLILDYLRARLVATPEHPACLPEVDARDAANFNSLVDYLGLADEFQLNKVEECVFGKHSPGVTISEDRTSASFSTCSYYEHRINNNGCRRPSGSRVSSSLRVARYSQGIVLSENTYTKGVIRWQLFFERVFQKIFVGLLKDDPISVCYGDIHKTFLCHRNGSFGWTLGNVQYAILNSASPEAVGNERVPTNFLELRLDCQRKTLTISFLKGQKFHIPLPNLASWRLQVGLQEENCSVRIEDSAYIDRLSERVHYSVPSLFHDES